MNNQIITLLENNQILIKNKKVTPLLMDQTSKEAIIFINKMLYKIKVRK